MTVTRSKIEWTDSTWNPTTGCTQISDGCDHCYAKAITERFHGQGSFDRIQLHPDRLDAPLRWRKPRKVFVNSMSDLFHKDVPDEFIARVWAVMAMAPLHTFQVLTKRHGRMQSILTSTKFWRLVGDAGYSIALDRASGHYPQSGPMKLTAESKPPGYVPGKPNEQGYWEADQPLPNVWLGVSVEDQRAAEFRIPALWETSAAVRFVSCEPVLASVDLSVIKTRRGTLSVAPLEVAYDQDTGRGRRGIDWVIAGGESGQNARPMHPDWARNLRDQCVAAGVPFHFKQRGQWTWDAPDGQPAARWWVSAATGRLADERTALASGGDWCGVWRVGKTAAGRELDGETWDQFPG